MEKKKGKLGKKIAALMAILTIGSCCFLGTTFAKYTSSTSGTASTQVALWDVSGVSDATADFALTTTSKLSPSFDSDTQTIETSAVVIENKSDVSAKITYTAADLKFYVNDTTEFTPTSDLTADNLKNTFTVSLQYAVGDSTTYNAWPTGEGAGFTLDAKGGTTTKITIKAVITWKTISDAIDTQIGKNIVKVSAPITLTATQASELPV